VSAATAVLHCPYPGCALNEEHDGDYVPRYRVVQRYAAWNPMSKQTFPGFCENGEGLCRGTAVALYANHCGRSIELCAKCEDEFIGAGATKLGGAA
jgi:hypothetical protein